MSAVRGPPRITGVALAGFMAVGKSTVGPLLAERLELPWWDLDVRVEKMAGCSIPSLFRDQGEPAFRALELSMLREGVRTGPSVVSLGGGALLTAGAAEALAEAGFQVVVLTAHWDTIRQRIAQSDRPLAASAEQLFFARADHYRQLGRSIPTDDRTPDEVVDAVVEALGVRHAPS
jgi:shikimate kinase